MEQEKEFKQAVFDFLMRRHRGVRRGRGVVQEDIDLILRYHRELHPHDLGFFKNALGLFRHGGVYGTEMEAVLSLVPAMRRLTDRYNREFAAVVTAVRRRELVGGERVRITRYRTSGVVAGRHGDVVAIAIAGSALGLLRRLFMLCGKPSLVHTHPNSEAVDPNHLSGDPANLREIGDVSATEILRYKSIYLIAPDGSLTCFEGRGQGNNRAQTKAELRRIRPLATNLPRASLRYLVDPETGRYFPVGN
ncbi:MAG: hypothetical protein FWG23_02500 [Eggerthellaceae bacterium]|jgi:hypothetical protein|nr:hypothetical protein [Eggerthellaceae bacterium]MDR2715134.1 hypothetical protein [Coriobacteriaceae bacterium]